MWPFPLLFSKSYDITALVSLPGRAVQDFPPTGTPPDVEESSVREQRESDQIIMMQHLFLSEPLLVYV